jgi:ubiquinone/menaquinone biosynthesis C-methylase UbiE
MMLTLVAGYLTTPNVLSPLRILKVESIYTQVNAQASRRKEVMEEIFFEIFESLPRQGPGDRASTEKAFRMLEGLPDNPRILDVGCGTGGQTLVLAGLTQGEIIALDNHAPFIKILENQIQQAGIEDGVKCVVADMASMDFDDESFDLIWSEGAANLMGVENALKKWKPLLRPNGYLVISELVWFKERVPKEIEDFFKEHYPDMRYYKDIYPMAQQAAYDVVGYFPLPDESWWTDYYTPAEKKIAEMRQKYTDSDAQEIFDVFQLEMDMHRKYAEYYGYGFYIMKKK